MLLTGVILFSIVVGMISIYLFTRPTRYGIDSTTWLTLRHFHTKRRKNKIRSSRPKERFLEDGISYSFLNSSFSDVGHPILFSNQREEAIFYPRSTILNEKLYTSPTQLSGFEVQKVLQFTPAMRSPRNPAKRIESSPRQSDIPIIENNYIEKPIIKTPSTQQTTVKDNDEIMNDKTVFNDMMQIDDSPRKSVVKDVEMLSTPVHKNLIIQEEPKVLRSILRKNKRLYSEEQPISSSKKRVVFKEPESKRVKLETNSTTFKKPETREKNTFTSKLKSPSTVGVKRRRNPTIPTLTVTGSNFSKPKKVKTENVLEKPKVHKQSPQVVQKMISFLKEHNKPTNENKKSDDTKLKRNREEKIDSVVPKENIDINMKPIQLQKKIKRLNFSAPKPLITGKRILQHTEDVKVHDQLVDAILTNARNSEKEQPREEDKSNKDTKLYSDKLEKTPTGILLTPEKKAAKQKSPPKKVTISIAEEKDNSNSLSSSDKQPADQEKVSNNIENLKNEKSESKSETSVSSVTTIDNSKHVISETTNGFSFDTAQSSNESSVTNTETKDNIGFSLNPSSTGFSFTDTDSKKEDTKPTTSGFSLGNEGKQEESTTFSFSTSNNLDSGFSFNEPKSDTNQTNSTDFDTNPSKSETFNSAFDSNQNISFSFNDENKQSPDMKQSPANNTFTSSGFNTGNTFEFNGGKDNNSLNTTTSAFNTSFTTSGDTSQNNTFSGFQQNNFDSFNATPMKSDTLNNAFTSTPTNTMSGTADSNNPFASPITPKTPVSSFTFNTPAQQETPNINFGTDKGLSGDFGNSKPTSNEITFSFGGTTNNNGFSSSGFSNETKSVDFNFGPSNNTTSTGFSSNSFSANNVQQTSNMFSENPFGATGGGVKRPVRKYRVRSKKI